MKSPNELKITLIGAGGMSFGPVMVHDAVHSPKIAGSTLMLYDVCEERLDNAYRAADRLNGKAGEPLRMERTTSAEEALSGADFLLMSIELERFKGWKQDYEIPVKHGSIQIMGENGGPGGMFHSLRSIKTCMAVCRQIESLCPDAYLINLTNPMSRVCLAINRATKLRNVGLCHEFDGGRMRVGAYLLTSPSKIQAKASGINHFTFFHEINHADSGEDLYPKLRKHRDTFPWIYPALLGHLFREYDHLATSSDSHIGEYVPFAKEVVGKHMSYNEFFRIEGSVRDKLTQAYGRGMLPLPLHKLPRSGEQAFPILESIACGERTYIDAVNVPNRGYVPNLPEGSIVEVPAWTGPNDLEPETVPPIHEPLADLMNTQVEIQNLVVDAALNADPDAAFEAIRLDPLSPPDEASCRRMFDEMRRVQEKYLPF